MMVTMVSSGSLEICASRLVVQRESSQNCVRGSKMAVDDVMTWDSDTESKGPCHARVDAAS